MNALEQIHNHTSALLKQADVFTPDQMPDVKKISKVVENCPAMVTVHTFKKRPFFVYLNNRNRDFCGFDQNDVSGMNMSFYLKTFHPATITILPHSYQFFSEDQRGFLNLTYRLKNAQGSYEHVRGTSRSIAWDETNTPTYVLSITCPESEWRELSTMIDFGLESLSPRQRACLPLLLQGSSNANIAHELGLSPKTVESYVGTILKTAGVKSRRDLLSRKKLSP